MVNAGSAGVIATAGLLDDKDTDLPVTSSRSYAGATANGRATDAPGSTGRGPALISSINHSSDSYAASSWNAAFPTLAPRADSPTSPQGELIRAGEAEREAQRQMIDAQRETLRASDQVIEALRRKCHPRA